MTLRLRLVLALVALVTVASAVFLAATYSIYRSSQFRQLDTQLRTEEPVADQTLDDELARIGGAPLNGSSSQSGSTPVEGGGLGAGPGPFSDGPDGHRGPSLSLPPGTVAERVTATGTVSAHVQYGGEALPKLPAQLPATGPGGRIFTTEAMQGSTEFRVLQMPAAPGGYTVVAIPTTAVTESVDRLLLIEGAAVAALLVVMSGGAWLVLRRGLRPLERMAHTASRISAGDLSQRVSPAGGPSEVGQLGLALNTMLGDIESAFAEREATEQKLRQFLADASHELRTPLTSIQGFAELFRVSGEQARVDLPTILRRIEEESARMKVLVEDLLLLARLDQHRDIEKRPTDLSVLAADACTDAAATDPSRSVTLEAPEPVVASVDEAQLRQALANLVTNALVHTRAGTPLEVACRREGDTAVLAVRDHGPGLDGESLRHVFDRFWQGDKARVGTGSGLGLSIVAAIAAEHGGSAGAANAPGGGALFTITLPLDGAGGPAAGGASAAGAGAAAVGAGAAAAGAGAAAAGAGAAGAGAGAAGEGGAFPAGAAGRAAAAPDPA